jgi:hypothetical protein
LAEKVYPKAGDGVKGEEGIADGVNANIISINPELYNLLFSTLNILTVQ